MRKMMGTSLTALALLFGGTGIANATVELTPAPVSTTTVVAQQDADDSDSGDNGLWGLAGLLGLLGLLGLKRRKDHDVVANRGVTGGPGTTPRA